MITDFATSEAENTMSSQASQSDSGSGSGHQTGFTREKPCIAGGGEDGHFSNSRKNQL